MRRLSSIAALTFCLGLAACAEAPPPPPAQPVMAQPQLSAPPMRGY